MNLDESIVIYDRYRVTKSGKIISLNYANKGIDKELKPQKFTKYLGVNICGKIRTIHRLVAIAFIPNPENKPHVNHKDGNGHNNDVSNLEWVTRSENGKHAFRVLGIKNNRTNSGNYYGDSFGSKSVTQFSKDGIELKTFDCIRRASHELKISETSISNCLAGRSKSAGGFLWKCA
jgi:hypothetical protein